MRIDQNSYLNPAAFTTQTARVKNQDGIQGAVSIKGSDRVEISREARQAYESYALNTKKKNDAPDAKEDFRDYLKRCREAPKTPEDRLKELQEKLKAVQEKISETAEQAGISDPSKLAVEEAARQGGKSGSEAEALSLSQQGIDPSGQDKLEALYVQMDQIIEEIQKVAEEL